MSPLCMETVTESPVNGDLHHGPRRDKNRDAARKSRRKQTERADELHEELQTLERSNSTLQNEIAELKREMEKYERILKDHEPNCCLRGSTSSDGAFPSAIYSTAPHSIFTDQRLVSASTTSAHFQSESNQTPSQSTDDAFLFGDTSLTSLHSLTQNTAAASQVCPKNHPSQTPHASLPPVLFLSPVPQPPTCSPPTSPELSMVPLFAQKPNQEVMPSPAALLPQTTPSDEALFPFSQLVLLQDDCADDPILSEALDLDEINCWISNQTG
ncbi:proto-oncogene c-Fos isoform X2 [Gouania willdenowi]|uniref:proto-oncogene c-Fos isoform X2 n=1 Tax=Gouania willdenowi TaxID=441366 RepID=UPI001055F0C0|nr:proto-oncogene c-Fos-like isoform X2 [Gouania willdenowi]